MIPSFSTGGVLTAPPGALITGGYVPGNTLAAQHLNWYLNHLTMEINAVLTASGVAQNSAVDTQLRDSIVALGGGLPTPVADLGYRLPLGVPTPIAECMLAATGTARHAGAARNTTTTTAGHLIDSGASFIVDGVQAGDYAYNYTDGTTAKITVVNSATDCSIDADGTIIANPFPTGKSYKIFPNITLPANVKRCDGSTISDGASPFNGLILPNLNAGGTFADAAVSGGCFPRGGTTAGVIMEDGGQSHLHQVSSPLNSTGPGASGDNTRQSGTATTFSSGAPIVDGSNGTPRMGKETRGRSYSVVYVIRIK